MSRMQDLTGIVYGRLIAKRYMGIIKGRSSWECLCECGNIRIVVSSKLLNGHTQSCGCYRRDRTKEVVTKHGMSYGSKTYAIWQSMIRRCTNLNHKDYDRYMGRGISVCEGWTDFSNFLNDMGERPENLTLERIDNEDGYNPQNCIWADRRTQANNTSRNVYFEINNERLTLRHISIKYCLDYKLIKSRINQGWSLDRAMRQPHRYLLKQQELNL